MRIVAWLHAAIALVLTLAGILIQFGSAASAGG
jgi:hypothetical protein